ncbi:MAG TPA: glycoside hydrolase family 127 protein [Candidatus Hydrogenedentes bacterium]|nr:glycoside hydrolase family 127 protein [Candidatus Hydrogenedentota bacterium]HPG68167.1 glycoside hydrolase family 127 protein [Candidatus Hydrogenedentota bacterium]
MRLRPFELGDVVLLDGPCKVAQEANREYLRALDADRLLHAFRVNAGLDAPGEPLGGWERPDCEVRGHFVGHFVSACAEMYATTGDLDLKAKADYMVAEMAKCQQALGGSYLSAYPEAFWDRLERMENPPWAPYYTIHKIMAGLYDAYRLCGNAQALDVLQGMAAYFKGRYDKLSIWEWDRLLGVEFGGMAEVLYDLYGVTGDPAHLDIAHAFDRAVFLGPLALDHDDLSRIHANTHIPEIIGAARRYELLGDTRYRNVVSFFWDCVVEKRIYATGGTSNGEHWPDPYKLAGTLSAQNQESCTSHNMLWLTRHLIQWTGEAKYADFAERLFFNSILGTQRASDGMLIYFLPLACGQAKTYGTPNDSFWCCYGTGIEGFAMIGDSIYFHDDQGVYVNMFVPSEVTWRERGVRLAQQTSFPADPKTRLVVHAEAPATFGVNVRIPAWAGPGFGVRVNGKRVAMPVEPVAYLRIEREWCKGDTVDVDLPMVLHVEPLPDDPDTVALLYGPLVLAGLTNHEVTLIGDVSAAASMLDPVEGQVLTFRTHGQPEDVTFVPLNGIVEESYGVYFLMVEEGSPRHQAYVAAIEAQRRFEARVVDRVIPGDATLEKAHGLDGEHTQDGPYMGKHWRHASDGGWFGWDLTVVPDASHTLSVMYWGDDVPPREFDVLVDGVVVGSESLNKDKPGELFRVEYPLTSELTQGKAKVTVRFQAHPGNTAGGVFECAILKPE